MMLLFCTKQTATPVCFVCVRATRRCTWRLSTGTRLWWRRCWRRGRTRWGKRGKGCGDAGASRGHNQIGFLLREAHRHPTVACVCGEPVLVSSRQVVVVQPSRQLACTGMVLLQVLMGRACTSNTGLARNSMQDVVNKDGKKPADVAKTEQLRGLLS